jgi:GNAT superfamily N-acetyltransferase
MVAIRSATREDASTILRLIRELAIYEREPESAIATEEDILRDGFGEVPAFHVLLAEIDGAVVGFALYYFIWSTWRGKKCLHLEDLFVEVEHRGKGAGLALMRALAKEAVDAGCARFVWQVLGWNKPAIDFYERLGAKVLDDWWAVRLEGDALADLARQC